MTVTITADQVRQLREQTGAGMMECKKALSESGGDFQKAIDALRKSGIAKAEKRAPHQTWARIRLGPASDLGPHQSWACAPPR